jgi:hypothetical protein
VQKGAAWRLLEGRGSGQNGNARHRRNLRNKGSHVIAPHGRINHGTLLHRLSVMMPQIYVRSFCPSRVINPYAGRMSAIGTFRPLWVGSWMGGQL